MADQAQLARIAAARPEPAVKIYKLDKGVSIWFWLCVEHLKTKKRKGWQVMETRSPPHALGCDECNFERGRMRT